MSMKTLDEWVADDEWLEEAKKTQAEFLGRARKDPALMLAYVIDRLAGSCLVDENEEMSHLWCFAHAVCGICKGPERTKWLADLEERFEECVAAEKNTESEREG